MEKKRFAVLLCAEDSEYVKKRYGGYFSVFVELLGEEGEVWDVYGVCQGEFPADNQLPFYDGFVITGSCSDADGNDSWILSLVALLQTLDSMRKKILGICFGHQILGRALGGKTGRAINGWDIGLTAINVSSNSCELMAALKIVSPLRVIQCHRDEVLELPARAEVIAWSEKTGVEMFRCGEHIMGIQGHPEYNKDILLHLLDRLRQRDLIQASLHQHVEAAKASVDAHEPDGEAWKSLCRGFLKGAL
ncbi:unnamed protein product [Spirodela intermedia]|uniref:Glutamine amidotransferase domain-containing protein n=1 Tax=Spirodela intermedia TaxID=51605 RepID=A0A7I8K9N3_SPIIN|nr:unnamed protein product [Spirodela intermedia]